MKTVKNAEYLAKIDQGIAQLESGIRNRWGSAMSTKINFKKTAVKTSHLYYKVYK